MIPYLHTVPTVAERLTIYIYIPIHRQHDPSAKSSTHTISDSQDIIKIANTVVAGMGCLRIRWFQSIVWIALNCGEIAREKRGKEGEGGGDVEGEKEKS